MDGDGEAFEAVHDVHGFGSLVDGRHITQPRCGKDAGQRAVDDVVGDAGIGAPVGRILKALHRRIKISVGAAGDLNRGVKRVDVVKSCGNCGFVQVHKGDGAAGRCLDDGGVWLTGQHPEGVDFFRAEGRSGGGIAHIKALNFVPDADVTEKALRGGCGAGPGVADADAFAHKVRGGGYAAVLAHHKVRGRAVKIGHSAGVVVAGGILRQPSVAAKVRVAGVDDAEFNVPLVQALEVGRRTAGPFRRDFQIVIGLRNVVGHGVGKVVERAADRAAAKGNV